MATKAANHYASAVRRIAALQARDRAGVNPLARTWFKGHGARVGRAIVLLHGYTNSPPQFQQLGQRFYDLGYNVLIPRVPHHGLADRLTTAQARLTAEELKALVDEVVGIARGLGRQVTVAGLSMGGAMAGYAAQAHEIDRAVLIAPAFGFRPLPLALSRPAAFLARHLPNLFIWWDPQLKAAAPGPDYGYPRYSTRALAQILRLSLEVQARARYEKPAAGSILIITNANDDSVSNPAAGRMAGHWRAAGANLAAYEFPAEMGLPHDLIDPANAEQQVEAVYPVLVDLIAGRSSLELP